MIQEGYDHTQYGKIHFLLQIPAVICLVASYFLLERSTSATMILISVGIILLLFSFTVIWLRVYDLGEHIKCTFGPIKLLSKKTAYCDIAEAYVSRSKLIDGWGIHKVAGRGWTYNIWGYDCVEFKLTNGNLMRIGTDDPANLANFIQSKLNSPVNNTAD